MANTAGTTSELAARNVQEIPSESNIFWDHFPVLCGRGVCSRGFLCPEIDPDQCSILAAEHPWTRKNMTFGRVFRHHKGSILRVAFPGKGNEQ